MAREIGLLRGWRPSRTSMALAVLWDPLEHVTSGEACDPPCGTIRMCSCSLKIWVMIWHLTRYISLPRDRNILHTALAVLACFPPLISPYSFYSSIHGSLQLTLFCFFNFWLTLVIPVLLVRETNLVGMHTQGTCMSSTEDVQDYLLIFSHSSLTVP